MPRLPLEVQTLYSELLEQLLALAARREIGSAPGTFTTKSVKGETYYYFQYSEPGGARQLYLGRKGPSLESALRRFHEERPHRRAEEGDIRRLCSLLRAGGAQLTDAPSARVLKALADAGLFHSRAVLVGTHAFSVLGNLLGARWERAAARTQDLDIGTPSSLSLAVPEGMIDLPQALSRLEMGFLPVPQLDPRQPSTSFKVRGRSLRVDLLTPSRGRESSAPVLVRALSAAAQPLRFLDYLIENPEKAAVIDGGGVLVNVPAPARYAFHKLVTAVDRPVVQQSKSAKDLLQAAQLFSTLAEDRPGDLSIAWEALCERGAGWRERAKAGFARLSRAGHPVLAAARRILTFLQ